MEPHSPPLPSLQGPESLLFCVELLGWGTGSGEMLPARDAPKSMAAGRVLSHMAVCLLLETKGQGQCATHWVTSLVTMSSLQAFWICCPIWTCPCHQLVTRQQCVCPAEALSRAQPAARDNREPSGSKRRPPRNLTAGVAGCLIRGCRLCLVPVTAGLC